MKIIGCHIENFGKLSDFTYAFEDGCNVICEDNGWGKSTLAAFVRVMLFGFSGEGKRGEYDNERKRYMPWQKGIYGGELKFEAGGKRYSLRRVFGRKAAEDEFVLTDQDTGLHSNDFSSKTGEELFQIDAESFARTVFLSQNDCETGTTDSINAKIGNLAENTDDINNYETVSKKLTELMNSMTPSRKTGSLYKMKARMTQLQRTLSGRKDIEETILQISEKREECRQERERLALKQKALQEQQSRLGQYKDMQAKRDKYLDLQEACRKRRLELTEAESVFNGVLPDREELNRYTQLCKKADTLAGTMEIYHFTREEEKELEPLQERFREKAPEERELDQAGKLAERYDILRTKYLEEQMSADEKQKLSRYRQKYGDNVPQVKEVTELQDHWRNYTEKRNMLGEKERSLDLLFREAARKEKMEREAQKQCSGRRTWGALVLAAGGLLILAAALLFVFGGQISPVLAETGKRSVIAVPSAVLGAAISVLGILLRKKGKIRHRADWSVPEETAPAVTELQQEIDGDRACMERIKEAAGDFCERYNLLFDENDFGAQLAKLQMELGDYSGLLHRQSEEKGVTWQNLKETERCLQNFFERYGIPAREDADSGEGRSYLLAVNEMREQTLKWKQLRGKQEQLMKMQRQYREIEKALQEYLRSLKLIPGDNLSARFAELTAGLQICTTKKEEFQRAETERERFEEKENVSALASLRKPEGEDSLENLAAQAGSIAKRMDELYVSIGGYQSQIDKLEEELEEIGEAAGELEQLSEQIRADQYAFDMLGKTKILLEQAKSSFTAKYTEPVMSGFQKYYRILTGESSDAFEMDANTQLHVVEQNLPRDLVFQSCGNRDLIGICMRMALIDVMYRGEKPFLILDDPFVNLDAFRTRGGRAFLEKISREYQVIYFTCHESRV